MVGSSIQSINVFTPQTIRATLWIKKMENLDAMFVGILLRDSARDFNVELSQIESSRHREIFEISSRAVQKL